MVGNFPASRKQVQAVPNRLQTTASFAPELRFRPPSFDWLCNMCAKHIIGPANPAQEDWHWIGVDSGAAVNVLQLLSQ
jgi:hypothetical protein